MDTMGKNLRRTWAEINLDHLAYNYEALRRQAGPQAKFLGVVKADAYGHGAVHVARKLERLGADYLAVSNVEEAEELRQSGVKMPILILGYTPAEMTSVLLACDVAQDVPSLEMARAYSREACAAGGTLRVHLKIDTGMGRLGFQCDEGHFQKSLEEILEALALPGLAWEGIFMHFCVSDEPDCPAHRSFTALQYQRFCRIVEEVEGRSGVHFAIHHCANSGATAYYPEYAWDMVRPGILLYGAGQVSRDMGLRPVMTLKSAIGQVKEFDPDTSISYGRTYYTARPGASRIGVLPIGYGDGLFRCLSNRWQVLTGEGMAPIRGRICMDMCMVDLTELPGVGSGDTVEIFGEHNLVDDMAEAAGTITYELLSAVSRRVPRIYLEGGQAVERNLLVRP